MAELLALASCWLRHRQVRRASVFVTVSTIAVLSFCGWRLTADRGRPSAEAHAPVSVAQLVVGHRYALVPWIVLGLLAVGVAGSVASSDSAYGLAAAASVHRTSLGRSLVHQVLADAVAAMAWFAIVATSVAVAASVMLLASGHRLAAGGPELATGIWTLVHLVLTVGLLTLVAAALGVALPASALPAMAVPFALLVGELVLQVLSHGSAALFPGGSLAVLALGPVALDHGMAPRWVAIAVPGAVLVAAPISAAVSIAVIVRFRPPPS